MPCPQVAVYPDPLRVAREMVDQVVTDLRNHGFTRERVIGDVAALLGVSPRRVQAFLKNEVFSLTAAEFQQIRAAYRAHLEAQVDYHLERAERARAEAQKLYWETRA